MPPCRAPADPQLTTAGIGRADVWVFDANSLGTTFGGTPLQILSFFADTPRGLAVTPDGSTVYVAAFQSGNQTTTINETVVPDGFGPRRRARTQHQSRASWRRLKPA